MKKLNSVKGKSLKNEMLRKVLGGKKAYPTCSTPGYDKETIASCSSHVQCDVTYWRH